MNLITRFFRKPATETEQKKAAVDRAYARFMQTLRGMDDFWQEIWEPDYKAQPLKIENKVE